MSAHRRGKKSDETGHLSLVDAEDESKVICHIFPFPVDQKAQTLGERDGTEAYIPVDEDRCQIIHTGLALISCP